MAAQRCHVRQPGWEENDLPALRPDQHLAPKGRQLPARIAKAQSARGVCGRARFWRVSCCCLAVLSSFSAGESSSSSSETVVVFLRLPRCRRSYPRVVHTDVVLTCVRVRCVHDTGGVHAEPRKDRRRRVCVPSSFSVEEAGAVALATICRAVSVPQVSSASGAVRSARQDIVSKTPRCTLANADIQAGVHPCPRCAVAWMIADLSEVAGAL